MCLCLCVCVSVCLRICVSVRESRRTSPPPQPERMHMHMRSPKSLRKSECCWLSLKRRVRWMDGSIGFSFDHASRSSCVAPCSNRSCTSNPGSSTRFLSVSSTWLGKVTWLPVTYPVWNCTSHTSREPASARLGRKDKRERGQGNECMHVYACVCMCMHVYACVCVCMRVCVCVCVYNACVCRSLSLALSLCAYVSVCLSVCVSELVHCGTLNTTTQTKRGFVKAW